MANNTEDPRATPLDQRQEMIDDEEIVNQPDDHSSDLKASSPAVLIENQYGRITSDDIQS